MKRMIQMIALVITLSLSGCAGKHFQTALEVNTVTSYDQFLKEYGDSEYGNQAREHREKAWFDFAVALDTISAYDGYLKEYPQGKYRDDINHRKEDRWFANVKQKRSVKGITGYLKAYPQGRYTDAADTFWFNTIKGSRQPEDYMKYLRYTSSVKKHAEEARKLHQFSLYNLVREKGTIALCKQYIRDYRRGQFIDQVEKIFYKAVAGEDRLQIYDTFSNLFPRSSFMPELKKRYRNRIDVAAENRTASDFQLASRYKWEEYKKKNAYVKYYQQYPDSPYVTEAVKRILGGYRKKNTHLAYLEFRSLYPAHISLVPEPFKSDLDILNVGPRSKTIGELFKNIQNGYDKNDLLSSINNCRGVYKSFSTREAFVLAQIGFSSEQIEAMESITEKNSALIEKQCEAEKTEQWERQQQRTKSVENCQMTRSNALVAASIISSLNPGPGYTIKPEYRPYVTEIYQTANALKIILEDAYDQCMNYTKLIYDTNLSMGYCHSESIDGNGSFEEILDNSSSIIKAATESLQFSMDTKKKTEPLWNKLRELGMIR